MFFIDGFNVYHAIVSQRLNSYKWLNYWALSEKFLRGRDRLVDVICFTAYSPWNENKRMRGRNRRNTITGRIESRTGHLTTTPIDGQDQKRRGGRPRPEMTPPLDDGLRHVRIARISIAVRYQNQKRTSHLTGVTSSFLVPRSLSEYVWMSALIQCRQEA